ncbi:hypothetical protein GGR57DRAFT_502148 [Xylariaceae sp. FL1272]|nr:hypothetical protein GGR57DRAFT_502148 [Xylariaceae sp. FL1272]
MPRSPPDPRNLLPSRADPEHRQRRKQLEKEHPFGFTEVAVLSMIGVGLLWDMEKQVQKHEEKHHKEEAEKRKREEREQRRRAKSQSSRNESRNPRSDGGRGERGEPSRRRAPEEYASNPRRRQSVAYGPEYDPQDSHRQGRHYDSRPRYEPRYERDPRYEADPRYEVVYEPRHEERERRGPETEIGRRSRRDSW